MYAPVKLYASENLWYCISVLLAFMTLTHLPSCKVQSAGIKCFDDKNCSGSININISLDYNSLTVSWNNQGLGYKGLLGYKVGQSNASSSDPECERVEKNVTSKVINTLLPGNRYTVIVIADFDDHCKKAVKNVTTKGYGGDASPCNCSPIGRKDDKCNKRSGNCACNNPYTGKKCEDCVNTHYRNQTSKICTACHCKYSNSFGSCKARNETVLCDCKPPFIGKKCEKCSPGYYGNKCQKCFCNENANRNNLPICDEHGKCLNCVKNTTGDHCEKCLNGYLGDAIIGNCTKYSDLHADESNHEKYLIIAVVVSFIIMVVLVVVIAILLYRRCARYRYKPFGLWTVQLRDDHETVNFSDQMEYHDADRNGPKEVEMSSRKNQKI